MTSTGPVEFQSAGQVAVGLADHLMVLDGIAQREASRWPEGDVRVAGPTNCKSLVQASGMVLNLLDHAESKRINLAAAVGVTGNAQAAYNTLEGVTKRSLTVMSQFQVENLLERLHRGLIGPSPGGFEVTAASLLRACGIASPSKKAAILYVPYLIRNTMHSNGFHDRRSRQVTIDGYMFRFREGTRFRQSGWHHLVWAWNAQWQILAEVLDCQRSVDGPAIRDRFARSVERYGR